MLRERYRLTPVVTIGGRTARYGIILIFLGLSSSGITSEKTSIATTGEGVLRKICTNFVVPRFPPDAIRDQRTGVAVARVEIDSKGIVTALEVLEAPTQSISSSVADAVRQWRFKPARDSHGRPLRIGGKLTFYFVIVDSNPQVLGPREARLSDVVLFPQRKEK